MHLSLPEKLEAFALRQVGEGFYKSTSEYVRELIRRDMQEKDEHHRLAFYAAVRMGDEQILQGKGRVFDHTTMKNLGQRARQNVTNGTLTNNREALPE
jgi:putative addiction module CopG family antidote